MKDLVIEEIVLECMKNICDYYKKDEKIIEDFIENFKQAK